MMIIIWINLAYNIMIINILYIMLLLYYYLNLLMCSSPVRTGCGQPGKGGDAGAGEWVTTEEGEKGTEDGERGNKVQKKRSERREMDEARVATTEQKGIWPTTKRALCCPEGSWGGGGEQGCRNLWACATGNTAGERREGDTQKPRAPETQGGRRLWWLKSARPTNAVHKNQEPGKINRAASRTNAICVVDKSRVCFASYQPTDNSCFICWSSW